MPAASSDDPVRRSSGTRHRTGSVVTVLFLLAGIGGLILIWSIEPVMGRGMQIAVTYGIVVLSCLAVLVWLAAFSSFRWSTLGAAFAILMLIAVAGASAVRSIEFDGDMQMILHYRWEPTQQELVQQHRQAAAASAINSGPVKLAPISELDAPAYRGAGRDGVIVGPPLKHDWQNDPPRELWRQPCGGGYSSFSIVDQSLVTLEQRGENETVVCYDAATGYERWSYQYPARFSEVLGGVGPRATPTIDEGTVFSYGALGDLVALDLLTGDVKWSKDLLPEGLPVVMWGMSSSPLVIGEQVIVEVGGPDGDGLVSVHRDTGDVLWQRPGVDRLSEPGADNRAGYSSPVSVVIQEVEQILIFDGAGLRSHDPVTGEQLWFAPFENSPGVNVAQPILFDDGRIFLSMSYTVGCEMIRVSRDGEQWNKPEVLWKNRNMKCKFTSPVLHEGYLYGLDEGILVCLDPQTGERMWKGGRDGTRGRFYHGQLLLTNGQIVGFTERGDLVLVEPTPQEYREVASFKAIDTRKVWNPPTLSRGIVYVRSHEEMAAFDLRQNPTIAADSR